MWYSSLYRRHLCDMHIEDWSDEFLSEFSPENYVQNLLTAGINHAMIYFQSHVGLCYWPTKFGEMHRALRNDPYKIRRLVDLCHENNIRVMGYYSINYNTREHDKHPEWRQLMSDGRSAREKGCDVTKMDFASTRGGRYGFCCPNNMEYREFVYQQIDEMIDFFEPDGLFFDMPFWTGTCFCESCRKRYREECGRELPENVAPDSEENLTLMTAKHRWMGEFVQEITSHIKARCPDMPVEHNFAAAISLNSDSGCGETVIAACDFAGGDLYGDLYNQSTTCKFMRAMSPNPPFEYMFSRCKPGLRMHTLTKSLDQMQTSLAVTMAHHGATLVIDAIDPVGTLDKRVYERFGQMFAMQMPYERYFTGKPICDIGVWYGLRSKNNQHGENMNCKVAAVGAIKASVKRHLLSDVVGPQDASKFQCVVAPLTSYAEPDTHRLIDYVRNGGTVYLSGVEDRELVETLTGGRYVGRTEENLVYVAPEPECEALFHDFNDKYPFPFEGTAAIMEMPDSTEVLAHLKLPYTKPLDRRFASIHSNPPGITTDIPAVTVNRFGKGRVIWAAVPIESYDMDEYGTMFTNLLLEKGGVVPTVESDAPGSVEITAFDHDDFVTLNCVLLDGNCTVGSAAPFTIRFRCSRAPHRVTLLPEETPVDFTYADGFVTFRTRTLHIFDMYKIEY